ncbi:hypothetical protein [Azomonas macrocytogenes]|uniref:Uncharacterized protein n=1 Tax=Azomonas macrocytogenes TaxID=69962 RepID=A0A839T4W8_AZOMA|nr:hypothetical protein [Azomonas macrocytogenes]MBB3103536.1 hypothetical protein [Azomonas macrocytogenes]
MAIVAVIFAVPFFLWLSYLDPEHSPPRILIMLLPLIYLIFGYVSVIVSCFCYNFMARFIGGIEYETKDP